MASQGWGDETHLASVIFHDKHLRQWRAVNPSVYRSGLIHGSQSDKTPPLSAKQALTSSPTHAPTHHQPSLPLLLNRVQMFPYTEDVLYILCTFALSDACT